MLSSVLAMFFSYWISRAERKYLFKKPLGIFSASLNTIVVSIISTVISFTIIYGLIIDVFLRDEYRVVGENLIGAAMFGLIFSGMVSFWLLRAEKILDDKQKLTTKKYSDEDNPWTQK